MRKSWVYLVLISMVGVIVACEKSDTKSQHTETLPVREVVAQSEPVEIGRLDSFYHKFRYNNDYYRLTTSEFVDNPNLSKGIHYCMVLYGDTLYDKVVTIDSILYYMNHYLTDTTWINRIDYDTIRDYRINRVFTNRGGRAGYTYFDAELLSPNRQDTVDVTFQLSYENFKRPYGKMWVSGFGHHEFNRAGFSSKQYRNEEFRTNQDSVIVYL